jgi:hypothetical protein
MPVASPTPLLERPSSYSNGPAAPSAYVEDRNGVKPALPINATAPSKNPGRHPRWIPSVGGAWQVT